MNPDIISSDDIIKEFSLKKIFYCEEKTLKKSMCAQSSSRTYYCCYENSFAFSPNFKSVVGFDSSNNSRLIKEIWGKKRIFFLNSQKEKRGFLSILDSPKINKLVSSGNEGYVIIMNTFTNKFVLDRSVAGAGKFYAGQIFKNWAILGSCSNSQVFVVNLLRQQIFAVLELEVGLKHSTSLAFVKTSKKDSNKGVVVLNSEHNLFVEIHEISFETK